MTTKATGRVFLLLSCLLSTLCIVGILVINHNIALAYNKVDGKTRALFGIIELRFDYQYLLLIPEIIALALGINYYRKTNNQAISIMALLFACMAIIMLFSRIWRYML